MFLQLKEFSIWTKDRNSMADNTVTEDTVGSGKHRLVLHLGAGFLAVLTLVGVSPLGSVIFGG
jgi:hypothetical protein